MIDWQLTATTIFCAEVEGEVTIFVYKDGSVNCTGFGRYPEGAAKAGPRTVCKNMMCQQVTGYRDRLFSEEAADNE
ncbi:MAG: hypothetical protein JW954_03670 [Dehalococcoidaceae bacterium]|nr:hypothetical protein [Dehalococcoidaceae bacterium]